MSIEVIFADMEYITTLEYNQIGWARPNWQ